MSTGKIDSREATEAFTEALATHQQAFGSFFLARFLGLDIAHEGECCKVSFEVRDFMFNPQGSLHGGITALVMDVSMGHLLAHLSGPGATLEMKTQYLKGITGGRVRAEGRLLKRGASVCFLESRLFDASGDLAAFSSATWKLLQPRTPAVSVAPTHD